MLRKTYFQRCHRGGSRGGGAPGARAPPPPMLGVFRVKNRYFTPKNHIFYNCGGRSEIFWGISCEKSRFYAPLDPPLYTVKCFLDIASNFTSHTCYKKKN
jgi:hypothetical protein